jgi:hypothetical protein
MTVARAWRWRRHGGGVGTGGRRGTGELTGGVGIGGRRGTGELTGGRRGSGAGELTGGRHGSGAVELTGGRSLWRGSPAMAAACVLFFYSSLSDLP